MSDQSIIPTSITRGESPLFDELADKFEIEHAKRLEVERKLVEAAYLEQDYNQVVDTLNIRNEPKLLDTLQRVLDNEYSNSLYQNSSAKHVEAEPVAPDTEAAFMRQHVAVAKRAGLNIAFGRQDFLQNNYRDEKVRVLGFLRPRRRVSERSLISQESQLGAQLVPLSDNVVRQEFFNEDPYNWYWHQELLVDGKATIKTIRYEIEGDTILKHDKAIEPVGPEELSRLSWTMKFYHDKVMSELYNINPETGEKLS